MTGIYVISIFFMIIGWLISARLKSKFKKYSLTPIASGMSGKEIAEKMLRDHNIHGVKVTSVGGMLTDHYNPANKTVNLSEAVYQGQNAMAAAVAAHECGHAVQHATAYTWLQMRSTLVPVVSFTSNIMHWILLAGIIMLNTFPELLLAGIGMFALTALFSVITLPVEFDASHRALVWLERTKMTNPAEQKQAKDALFWAAMTYLVSAMAALVTLFYYISIYMNRRS